MEVLTSIVDLLKLVYEAVKWAIKHPPAALQVISGILAATAVVSAYLWWSSLVRAEGVLYGALEANTEATLQPHKSLEALVLSGLPPDIGNINKLVLTKSYRDQLNDLEQRLKEASINFDKIPDSQKTKLLTSLYVVTDEKLQNSILSQEFLTQNVSPQSPTIDGVVIRKQNPKAFLFVPATIVRPPKPTPEAIRATVQTSGLFRVIWVTDQVGDDICALTANENVFDAPSAVIGARPVQSYYISDEGVLRVCRANSLDQERVYRDQFTPTRFFADRPYFADTLLTEPQSGPTVADYFHVTAPYLDSGGNGFVISMCKQLPIDVVTGQSILCLDFPLNSDVVNAAVSKHFQQIGGDTQEINCTYMDDGPICDPLQSKARESVRAMGKPFRNRLSEFFGRIRTIDDKTLDEGSAFERFVKRVTRRSSEPSSGLSFTVPTGKVDFDKATGKLLYCEIDLGKVAARQTLYGSVAVSSVIFLLCVIILMYQKSGITAK